MGGGRGAMGGRRWAGWYLRTSGGAARDGVGADGDGEDVGLKWSDGPADVPEGASGARGSRTHGVPPDGSSDVIGARRSDRTADTPARGGRRLPATDLLLPTAGVTVAAAVSGVGAVLIGPALLLPAVSAIRRHGSRVVGEAVPLGLAAIVLHQVATTLLPLPALLPVVARQVVAAIGAALFVLVVRLVAEVAGGAERDQERSAAEQTRVHAMLSGASDVTLIVGDDRVTYQSPSTLRVMGHEADTLIGQRYLDLVHPDDREDAVAFVRGLLVEPGASGLVDLRLAAAGGNWMPFECSCRNLLHDPSVRGFVVSARDVTERRLLEEQLEHRAFHDDLTGLANRALFLDRLEHTGARISRSGGRYAVLYVDLDGFKPINDSFGHLVGDQVLTTISERLRAATRRADTIARLGGDEFAILVEEHQEAVDAARIAGRILADVRRPIHVDDVEVKVTASVGIAYDSDGHVPADVLRNADIAMYLAKRDGRDRFEVFEPKMHLAVVERLHLESDLQRAIDNDELRCLYQPIVRLTDRRITGVEALVRWEHPERGTVGPGQFIPLAEETGLIVGIGRFVLTEACTQVQRWRAQLPAARDLTASVNVSMRQFATSDLLADVAAALRSSGLPADALTLELTESALAIDPDRTLELLHQLKALGVRLAIDDFGTGYSSLAYLHRFPVDVLKIDRSFVTSVVAGRQSPALARAIVDLGRSLDLDTVAEGIEQEAELVQFRDLDCSHGQGYLFSRPAPSDATGRLLAAAPPPEVVDVSTPDLTPDLTLSFDAARPAH
jgi:diguanylate cyclase (GGDEF)-like protein/PAS domain S-box-containing protein